MKKKDNKIFGQMLDNVDKFINSMTSVVGDLEKLSKQEAKIIKESKKMFSEAYRTEIDEDMPPTTYRVLDFNENIIALAWFENGRAIVIKNPDPKVTSKRTN